MSRGSDALECETLQSRMQDLLKLHEPPRCAAAWCPPLPFLLCWPCSAHRQRSQSRAKQMLATRAVSAAPQSPPSSLVGRLQPAQARVQAPQTRPGVGSASGSAAAARQQQQRHQQRRRVPIAMAGGGADQGGKTKVLFVCLGKRRRRCRRADGAGASCRRTNSPHRRSPMHLFAAHRRRHCITRPPLPGNICRSPSAEAVFKSVVERAGVADRFEIDSCGTGGGSRDWYLPGGYRWAQGAAGGALSVGQGRRCSSRRPALHICSCSGCLHHVQAAPV